eukprot:1193786-Prorocentrum_minimum.AAC.3
MQVRLVESLRDMEVAGTLLEPEGPQFSLTQKYQQLNCDLKPLAPESEDFALLGRYLANGQGPTHKDWGLALEAAFEANETRLGTSGYTPETCPKLKGGPGERGVAVPALQAAAQPHAALARLPPQQLRRHLLAGVKRPLGLASYILKWVN